MPRRKIASTNQINDIRVVTRHIVFGIRRAHPKLNPREAWTRTFSRKKLELGVSFLGVVISLGHEPFRKNMLRNAAGDISLRIIYSWNDNKNQLDIMLGCRTNNQHAVGRSKFTLANCALDSKMWEISVSLYYLVNTCSAKRTISVY